MTRDPSQLPNDIDALKATLIAELRERAVEASRAAHIAAELAQARAKASDDAALIAHQSIAPVETALRSCTAGLNAYAYS